jgi:AcrR family transcriptional regulator
MARPAGVSGADTMRSIRKAAIARIYKFGFEAMNLRDLAADVNLRVGSLYNYVPQKQEFLANLLEEILQELLTDLRARMANVEDAMERLRRFVEFHIEWHTARKEEVFIGNMELRSLSSEQYDRIVGLRRQYERYLEDILVAGQKRGAWVLEDARVTTFAMLSMLTGVCTWYKDSGRLDQAHLIRIHEDLVMKMLGIPATATGNKGKSSSIRASGKPASHPSGKPRQRSEH